MAHFAQIQNNIVQQVVVLNNNELLVNGVEEETQGITFLKSIFGQDTQWVQTSYSSSFRKNFASPGFTWDETNQAFIPEKPFNSWLLDTETYRYYAPVVYPSDGQVYQWNEDILNWELIILGAGNG